MRPRRLFIGDVAHRSGVTPKALRLYEDRGILAPPQRTASGYRVYPPETLGILEFVTHGRRLGLTLAEIKEIVTLRRAGSVPCTHVRQLL
jgi:DNA-binding transcriptional MerR regulator